MEQILLGTIIPLIVIAILIVTIYTLTVMLLDLFRINFSVFKILVFLVLYYFAGEYVFNLLQNSFDIELNPLVEYVYMPIHIILEALNITLPF